MTYFRIFIALSVSFSLNAAVIYSFGGTEDSKWKLSPTQSPPQSIDIASFENITLTANPKEATPKRQTKKEVVEEIKKVIKSPPKKQMKSQAISKPVPPKIIESAKIKYTPPPLTYPQSAIQEDKSGKVTIKARVSSEGIVTMAKVLRSSGSKILDQTALKWFEKLQFAPAYSKQGAMASEITQVISFTLKDNHYV